MRFALVIVDMINDFVNGSSQFPPAPNRDTVVANCQLVLNDSRRKELPIIYVNDLFTPAEKDTCIEFNLWGQHAIENTPGAKIILELEPAESDFIIPKKRYSGFTGTSLALLLNELDVKGIVAVGIQTNCCVQHTVMDAFFLGYRTAVIPECCDAANDDDHLAGLEYMQRYYATQMLSVEDFLEKSPNIFGPPKLK